MHGGDASADTILHAISAAMATESEGEVLGLFGELLGLDVAPSETATAPRDLDRVPPVGLAALLDAASGDRPQIAEWIAAAGLSEDLDLWTRPTSEPVPPHVQCADGVPVVLTPVHGWGVLALLTDDPAAQTLSPEEAAAKGTAQAILANLVGDALVPELPAVGGLRRPSEPHAATVHVNLVLRYLAAAWELPPASTQGLVAIGGWNGEEHKPTGDDHELAAVVELAGWTPITIEGGEWRLGGKRAGDSSLMALARLVWPDLEAHLNRRRREAVLSVHGWRVLGVALAQVKYPTSGWFQPRQDVMVTTPAVMTLKNSFEDSPASARILGGKAHTGKTVIAQQLAKVLHHREMWDVLILRPDSRSLSEEAELTDIITSAREIWLRDRRRRCLVVIEDLRPVDSVALGEILATAAAECEVSVLALARYGDNGQQAWDAGDVATLKAIVTREQVFDLAQRMVQLSDVYTFPGGATADSIWDKTGGGDLLALEALLCGDLQPEHIQAGPIDRLLQLGLIEEGFSEECLTPAEREGLLAAGAVIVDGSIRASVSAGDRKRLAATEESRDAAIANGLQWALSRYFDCTITHPHDDAIQQLLYTASAYAPIALTLVVTEPATMERITGWLRTRELRTVVDVTRALRPHIEDGNVVTLLRIAIDSLVGTRAPAGPLARLVRLVERAQAVTPESDLTSRLIAWMKADHGLEWSLDGFAYFQERVSLAYAASLLGSPDAEELLLRLMPKFLHGIEIDRGSDLRALLALEDVMDRCARRREAVTKTTADRLADLPRFREITAHPPTDFSALMAWLALSVRRRFGGLDWSPLIEEHRTAVLIGMRGATPQVLSAALGHLASTNKGFANKLINRLRATSGIAGLDIRDVLRSRLTSGPAGDAAHMLRVVANVHAQLARELLFTGSSEAATPRDDLAATLAARINRAVDIKGAGQILPVCHRIDEEFATGPGFAFALAEHLGKDFTETALEYETRPSVVSYLLAGLWLAHASYREETTGRALDLVIEHLNRRDPRRQRFAARLGVTMSADGDYGQTVLGTLGERVSVERFVEIALAPDILPETLANVHRLARAAHPDFPRIFRERLGGWHARSNDTSWRMRGADALVFYAQLASTLRAGGDPNPVDTAVSWLRQNQDGDYAPATADYWNRVIRGLRGRPGHAATILLDLHRFDERIAEQVLELLMTDDPVRNLEVVPQDTSESPTEPVSVTTDRVADEEPATGSFLRRMLKQSTRDLATFANLLVAVDKINSDVVADLLEGIRGPSERTYDGVVAVRLSTGSWSSFLETFQYEQNTAMQATVGRQLARLRITTGKAKGESVLSRRSDTGTVLQGVVQERWQGSIEFIASPRIVTGLLRLSYMWDSTWGTSLGQAVSGERLVRRLSNLWLPDLDQLPLLLRVLEVTNSREARGRLIGWLASLGTTARLSFSRMELNETAWIVREAGLGAATRGYAIDGLAERLAGKSRTQLVRDPFEYWSSLGTAACALHSTGNEDRVPPYSIADGLLPGIEPAYLWWKAWSPEVSGDDDALAAAWATVERTLHTRMPSDHVAMALIAGVRLGLLTPDGLARDSAAWSVAASARLHFVAELSDSVVGAPEFGAWFAGLVPMLENRLSAPGMEFYQGFTRLASYRRADEPTFD